MSEAWGKAECRMKYFGIARSSLSIITFSINYILTSARLAEANRMKIPSKRDGKRMKRRKFPVNRNEYEKKKVSFRQNFNWIFSQTRQSRARHRQQFSTSSILPSSSPSRLMFFFSYFSIFNSMEFVSISLLISELDGRPFSMAMKSLQSFGRRWRRSQAPNNQIEK